MCVFAHLEELEGIQWEEAGRADSSGSHGLRRAGNLVLDRQQSQDVALNQPDVTQESHFLWIKKGSTGPQSFGFE